MSKETRINLGNGYVAFESAEQNPKGVSYVRILDANGAEISYWDNAEWSEDPECVMGAILGAMCSIANPEILSRGTIGDK